MDWRVQLSGDNSDLEELSKSFNSDNLKIYKDRDNYILSSSDFDGITEADIVLKKSEQILNFINGGSIVVQKLTKPMQVGSINSIGDTGERNHYIFAECAHAWVVAARPTVLINGKVQETFSYKDLPNWILLAEQNKNVADVLNHLKTGSNDITTLYKVYEIIAEDVGGEKTIGRNGWASRNKFKLFTHTANSPDAIGDKARHGVQKNQPPKTTMSLNEAKSFILHLVKCWLDSKITH
ncbi:hypothetical protein ACFLWH_00625 [Chloroflexota bacterium]